MAVIFADIASQVFTKPCESGAVHRTGAPVLRSSREEGTFEDSFWKTPQKGEGDIILKAAKAYQKHRRKILSLGRKQALQETGSSALPSYAVLSNTASRHTQSSNQMIAMAIKPINPSAIILLEWLCEMARLCKGKLYPSYEGMMEAVSLCKQTIATSIKQLQSIGILELQRRCKRMEDSPHRFEQTSNVYRLQLPKGLYRFLPAYLRPLPLPDCERWRRQEDTITVAFMLQAARMTPQIASLDDQAQDLITQVEDDNLRASLASLFSSFERSESTNQTQTLKDSSSCAISKDQPSAEPPDI